MRPISLISGALLSLRGREKWRSSPGDALRDKPDGDRRISITIAQSSEEVTIGVADSGGGIAENDLLRIFEPFFTTKEIGRGTGLGLSISYGIINDMGGTISASNTDQGACFVITLPVFEEETQAA